MADVPKIFAKPRVAGSMVPLPPSDPRARTAEPYLAADGEMVADETWWHRLASQGDVDLSATAPAKSAPANPTTTSGKAAEKASAQ